MEEMKEREVNNNYIKPYAIVKLGNDIARVIANGYNSASAQEKLNAVEAISSLEDLKDEAKVKFIGDIMCRPKRERFAIANKLFFLLDLPTKEQVEAEEV